MNKIVLILLFSGTVIWGQQNSSEDRLKGNVKTVEDKTFGVSNSEVSENSNYFNISNYNSDGQVASIKYMGDDSVMDTEEVYHYNPERKIQKIETFIANGSLDKIILYEYNSAGNMSMEKKMNAKNKLENQTVFSYNDQNLLTMKEQTFPEIGYSIIDRFMYNGQNQIVANTKENPSGITKEEYAYNERGELTEKDEYNMKNEKFSSIMYEYNENGDKISLYKFEPSGEMTYFEQYEYVYDTQGNWTEKTIYIKGDRTMVEKRKITYYP